MGKHTVSGPGTAERIAELTVAEVLAGLESEANWLEYVRGYARLHGWRTYHPLRSEGSEAGWPDLALCRPPRLILVELKRQAGELEPEQAAWLDDLERCDRLEIYRTWRPLDRPIVHAVLR